MSTPIQDRVTFRGRTACKCLARWIPVFERECIELGYIKQSIDIYQLNGNATASAGTHAGGAFDIKQIDPRIIKLAREMGAVTWARRESQGFDLDHAHGVLRGCPHNASARYQIAAADLDYNGLGKAGMGGPDDGPKVDSRRTYSMGISWAKKRQKDRSLVTKINTVKAKIRRNRELRKENAKTDNVLVKRIRAQKLRLEAYRAARKKL